MTSITLTLSLALGSLLGGESTLPFQDAAPFVESKLSIDHVSYDTPGDGQLWARGKTYKASFGADGATYIPFLGSDAPRNMPVRFQLASASVDGVPLDLDPQAQWSRTGDVVTLDRGRVHVQYLMATESIEQTFVFLQVPRGGELDVRMDVSSELALSSAGAGFRLSGERGGVNYGRATVVDGAGRRLDLDSSLEDGQISIRVPQSFLKDARSPLVVDPLITTFTTSAAVEMQTFDDVAYNAGSQHYFQVHTHRFSQGDYDIYGSVLGSQGDLIPSLGRWIDMTDDVWYDASVANSNEAGNFLTVAVAVKNDKYEIWGRLRSLPGTLQGGQFQISEPSEQDYFTPGVGGDQNTDTFNRYFVAYTHKISNNEQHVLGQSLQTSGTLVGGAQVIDDTSNEVNKMPTVSKSCGTGATAERRWNVVWLREDGEDDQDVRGAQMNSYGFQVTPSFSVDNTAEKFWSPQASAPLASPDGSARDFLVVYSAESGQDSYIRGRLFKNNVYQASFDINALEAEIVGDAYQAHDQFWPTIGTDGSQFVIAYSERGPGGQIDMYACTLRHQGSNLIATEAHQLLASNEADMVSPRLATQHDAGNLGSREVIVGFLNQSPGNYATVMGAIYETPDGWGVLGQDFCAGQTNSTGQSASFRVFGSPNPADNQFVLDVNGLPAFSFGQFIMSTTTQNVPLGNGTLCLGQPLLRLGNTLGSSWTKGSVGYDLDLTDLPNGTVLQGGQTWNFQYWYRDGGSSNLSNAQQVTFQ